MEMKPQHKYSQCIAEFGNESWSSMGKKYYSKQQDAIWKIFTIRTILNEMRICIVKGEVQIWTLLWSTSLLSKIQVIRKSRMVNLFEDKALPDINYHCETICPIFLEMTKWKHKLCEFYLFRI